MQRHHVAPSTFTDWSCLPPPSSSVLDSFASFGAPESLLSAQMPPKKPKIPKTVPTVAPTVNPFFPGFTEFGIASQSSSSTSPSQSDFNVGQFFVGDVVTTATTNAPPLHNDDCVLECSTFICGGGTWSVGGGFEKCKDPLTKK